MSLTVNGLVLSQLLGSPLLHTAMIIQACLLKGLSHKMDLCREIEILDLRHLDVFEFLICVSR
jgi:hypothetical protein